MRGKKAKMLRANAAQMMTGSGSPRQKYRRLKAIYQTLALYRSQQPAATPEPRQRSFKDNARTVDVRTSDAWAVKPMAWIRRRLKVEHTTISNLTGGRVAHIKHAPRVLARHELNTLALGGSLV